MTGVGIESETLLLSGTPPICTGEIALRNLTGEKVRVKQLPARFDSAAIGTVPLRVFARLAPHETSRVPAHVVIGRATPAGTYSAAIDVGGGKQARAVLRVFESHRTRVVPQPLELRGAPGEQLRGEFVVENRGNVVQRIPRHAMVFLEELDWLGRSVVHALREATRDEGVVRVLDRLVLELKDTMMPTTPVTLTSAAQKLAPGQSVPVEFEFTLPAAIVKDRRYRAFMKLFGGRVWLDVEVERNGAATQGRAG